MLYPDTDPKNAGRDSMQILREITGRTSAAWRVQSLDIVVECQDIKIAPIREKVIVGIAAAVGAEPSRVNVRGKTGERVDAVGRGEAIRATAVVLLVR
jgi:2-C-methyl-D-erythritol 2,4-cyclodiphosphate synthase